MKPIYLDHNATTPIDPVVAETITRCLTDGYMNPASQHAFGRRAHRVVEDAREYVAQSLGARCAGRNPDRVVFTSGGTEANNLAVLGLVGRQRGNLIISEIEHPSLLGVCDHLRTLGYEIRNLPVNSCGTVDLSQLDQLIDDHTQLVCLMLGNSETGVIQPVAEAATICARRGVFLHCDAVQAVGKITVDFRQLGVTSLSAAAHKFHGPRGIGALIVKHDAPLQPILFGGPQQMGLRPGTESVALAAGMHKALQVWQETDAQRADRLARIRDDFERRIKTATPETIVVGENALRLPQTSNLAFRGFDRQVLFMTLDRAGLACSTGSACASGSSEPSPVLLAMGCPPDVVKGSLRFSFGAFSTAAEAAEAARRILNAINHLGSQN